MSQYDGLIQIGEVQSIDENGRTVKVLHEDASGSVSTDLPIMRPKRPEVGDPVACIYLSNGQAFGVCLGAFYQDEVPPDGIIEVFVLPDGNILKYDTDTNKFIMAVQNLEIQAENISLAGGGAAVARVGDSVNLITGKITSGSSKVQAG